MRAPTCMASLQKLKRLYPVVRSTSKGPGQRLGFETEDLDEARRSGDQWIRFDSSIMDGEAHGCILDPMSCAHVTIYRPPN